MLTSEAVVKSVNSSFAELDTAISLGIETGAFFSLVDRESETLYESFRQVYPIDGFVKLLVLKLCNLIVAKYHFVHRHKALASRPIQLMLDPANNCQLQCPGCVHTGNREINLRFDWPGGLLDMETYKHFMRLYGPFAFGVVFYNYGEPLLNKRTPEIVRIAKRYFLHTAISSNLSVKFDVDALVESGLNCLFVSLDGATQKTYSMYRRHGNLELCYENIGKLVAAKKRLGSNVPYIEWKYLTFEHNVHEIDLAIRIAKDLGVDEIHVATPFAVDWDDPSVRVVDSPKARRYKFSNNNTKGVLDQFDSFTGIHQEIDDLFEMTWLERAEEVGVIGEESRANAPTCRWLYQSITLDAGGRILPCCMPPEKGLNRVYGKFPHQEREPFNAKDMILSRLAFADRKAFQSKIREDPTGRAPYCSICQENPELTYTVSNDVVRDIPLLDKTGLLSRDTIRLLTSWSPSQNQQYDVLRKVLHASLPLDATVIVVSKGDDELLQLGGRKAWHFPQDEHGGYAGYYPADSAEAIAHLEALRVKGGDFLLFPHLAFWWLDHYVDFKKHLESRYRQVVRNEDTCLIFALRERDSLGAKFLRNS